MPAWIGNVIGSAIGLVAILLGALWNAHLTRKRDMAMLDNEKQALAAAIGAEMQVYAETLCGRFSQALAGPRGRSKHFLDSLRQPDPRVWPAVARDIGKIGELSYDTVRVWGLLEFHAGQLGVTISEMQDHPDLWSDDVPSQRCALLKSDLQLVEEVITKLTGRETTGLALTLP